jgi:hypothetical protein
MKSEVIPEKVITLEYLEKVANESMRYRCYKGFKQKYIKILLMEVIQSRIECTLGGYKLKKLVNVDRLREVYQELVNIRKFGRNKLL